MGHWAALAEGPGVPTSTMPKAQSPGTLTDPVKTMLGAGQGEVLSPQPHTQ